MKYNNKKSGKFTLDCDYFDCSFDTLNELINYCLDSGMDTSYHVLRDGKSQGLLIEYIDF